jgi:predicted ATPase with chaperone activity
MRGREVRRSTKVLDEGRSLMRVTMTQLNRSACAYDHLLRLAGAIADLAGE